MTRIQNLTDTPTFANFSQLWKQARSHKKIKQTKDTEIVEKLWPKWGRRGGGGGEKERMVGMKNAQNKFPLSEQYVKLHVG